MTDIRKWSALAVVLVAAIFAASWFLLISPKRSEAAELTGKAVSRAEANSRLEQQIQVLKAQQEDLPRQRARLATLRRQIPDNPALPSLIRDLTAAGRKTGVSLDSLAPSAPVALVAPALVAAPVAAPAEGTETSTDTAAPAAPVAPAAPTASRTLYQVPVAVNVTGTYFELEQFINKIENFRRSFLVSGFSLSPNESAETPDSLTIALTGRVFLSQPAAAAPTTTPIAAPATTTGE
jgi:Tfp pilus assembly protein PilO